MVENIFRICRISPGDVLQYLVCPNNSPKRYLTIIFDKEKHQILIFENQLMFGRDTWTRGASYCWTMQTIINIVLGCGSAADPVSHSSITMHKPFHLQFELLPSGLHSQIPITKGKAHVFFLPNTINVINKLQYT